ncbi:tape measure protein [Rhodococcus phage NiceHouse]|nr:tape measure protein [Rhodococcus phage NiceHouse]
MQFNAQTRQAQAQIAALNAEMKALQSQQMLMNKMSSSVLSRGLRGPTMMDFNLRGPLGQMDELAKRIQKGKISQKEFTDTVRGTNKMYEYQNALQKANLSNIQKMGSQRFRTGINLPELQAQSSWLRRNAVEWSTAGAAAKAYGRQVMDTGKNMAFMGRQAMLSITAPLALIAGAAAATFYKVDQQLTDLQKVYGDVDSTSQVSSESIRSAARGLAQEINRQYAVAQKDTFALAQSFAALGESGKSLDDMTAAAARLMRLGDVTTDSAQKMISTLRTVFKLEGQGLEDAINMANTFENSSTLTMQDFADALPKMGAIVKSWNGNVEEAGLILEGFTRAGIPAVEGANALKAGFTKLVRPTTVLEGKFKDLTGGVAGTLTDIVKEYDGNVPKILAKIGEIQKAQNWDGYKKKNFAAQLWGAYQLNRGMALTDSLANPTEQMQKIIDMSTDELRDYNKAVADREVAVQMKSSSNQFKQTLNEIQMYAEKFGEKILPMITTTLKGIISLFTNVYEGGKKIIDALGPLGGIVVGLGKAAAIAAIAFGPLMLALSSFFLIKGGMITVLGLFGALIAKMKGAKGVTLFQTGSQRAAELQAKRMETMRNAETVATQRLTTAIQQLNAAYASGRTPTQMAQSTATKAANTTVNNANRVSSALNTQTNAISRNNRAINSPQRRNNLGGLVMSNNTLGNPARPAVTQTSNPTNPAYGQRIQQTPVMPVVPVVSPQNSSRTQSAIINQGKRDAQAYTNAFSQQAQRSTSQRQQALNQSFISPGRNSTIAGQATEQARRQAAGIGLMQTGNATRSSQAASTAAMQAQARADAARTDAGRQLARRDAMRNEAQNRYNAMQVRSNDLMKEHVSRIGGAMVGLGFIGSLLAGNNKAMQTGVTILMAMGTLAMIMPGLFSKMALAARGMAISMGITSAMMGTIGAMATALLGPLAIAAAIGATIYGAYRLITAGQKKAREEQEKINNSTEGWSKVLGYTRTQFGQMKTEAGEVVDTVASISNEMMSDENLKPLIEDLRKHSSDLSYLRGKLEREAVKLYADGANPQQVQTAIEAMLNAANISPVIEKELKLQFKNVTPTGLNGLNLSDEVKSEIGGIFSTREGNTASKGDQVIGHLDDEMKNWQGRLSNANTNTDLSNNVKGELATWINQMQLAIRNAEPKDKGKIVNNYLNQVSHQVAESLMQLPKEVQDQINARGGLDQISLSEIGNLSGIDGDQKDDLKYQKNLLDSFTLSLKNSAGYADEYSFMFKDLGTALLMMGRGAEGGVTTYEDAMNKFNSQIVNSDSWKALDDNQKNALFNWIRMSAGLEPLSIDSMKAAIAQQNLGNRVAATGDQAAAAAADVEGLSDAVDNGDGKVGDWTARLHIETDGAFGITEMSVEDAVQMRKDQMSGVMDDIAAEMEAEAQIQFDAQKRSFQDGQKAETDALSERQDAEKKAASKADELEKKNFDKGWDKRIEDETKAYDDRIKAIEDQQNAEDDLERTRKRNADRESRRLKYLQSLMQIGIDTNIAMAGGNLDEVARLSLNAAQTSTDYNTAEVDAEAGYKKEDEDRLRSKAIEQINIEKEERLKSLQEQRQMEQEAMNDRIEMRNEELSRKQKMESDYLARKQEDENIAYEISFQANQRALQRELQALRTAIPLNEAEIAAHIARLQSAYGDHGVVMTDNGERWATTIQESITRHMDQAKRDMSNAEDWTAFGNRVAEGISKGAFNMSGAQFNNFLRTGDMPDAPALNSATGAQAGAAFGIRHAGGPIGFGQDKYNDRAGIPMNAPMRSSEQQVLAQKGEFMMQRKAHQTYGTETMNAVNQGKAVILRHAGGPIGESGGFGAMGGGIQAAMMGALVSRAALAAGQAMVQAKSYGGFGGGPDIDVGGAGGGYGLPAGTNINYGAAGFPGWVYSLAKAKGVQASTYPGHQEGDRNEPGYARNPGRLNRGIDWSGSVPAMQGFAEYLLGIAPRTPTLEQIIWMNPNTGQKIGWHGRQRDDGSYFASDYGGHQDHVHTRSNGPIQPGEGASDSGGSVAPAASDDIKKKFPQYASWTTKGIDKYRDNAMAKFAPVYEYGGAGMDIEKGTFNGPVVEAVKEAVKPRGWDTGRQWDALYQLIAHESSWNPTASAWPASDAYGLFQFLSTTWATVGGQKTSDPYQQAIYGARYIASPTSPAANNGFSRDPVGAWGFWNSHYPNWYDKGGEASGIGYMAKNTLKPERVLSPQQTKTFGSLIPMLEEMKNMGIVGFDPILSALHRDNLSLQNAVTAPASGSSNIQINVTIKDTNILGVDDLDKRLEEWSNTIVQRVKQEQIDKDRRLGNR